MNIDDIIEDIERCIDDIKEINNAPDDERNEKHCTGGACRLR